jgi:hypothetical protein
LIPSVDGKRRARNFISLGVKEGAFVSGFEVFMFFNTPIALVTKGAMLGDLHDNLFMTPIPMD